MQLVCVATQDTIAAGVVPLVSIVDLKQKFDIGKPNAFVVVRGGALVAGPHGCASTWLPMVKGGGDVLSWRWSWWP